jgi:hypothetical protein
MVTIFVHKQCLIRAHCSIVIALSQKSRKQNSEKTITMQPKMFRRKMSVDKKGGPGGGNDALCMLAK